MGAGACVRTRRWFRRSLAVAGTFLGFTNQYRINYVAVCAVFDDSDREISANAFVGSRNF